MNFKNDFPQLESQCYLDNAGCLPIPKTLVERHLQDLTRNLYGNPHSTMSTTSKVNAIREQFLNALGTTGLYHSLVFTQNASAAMKLLIDTIDFEHLNIHRHSHSSIIGMGNSLAARKGKDVNSVISTVTSIDELTCTHNSLQLFAYPAQCNFSGTRYPLQWCNDICSQCSNFKVLLDASSLLSCGTLDLTLCKADFICISFYKLFGYPTGLGALVIKNKNLNLFKQRHFAGGTIDLVTIDPIEYKLKSSIIEQLECGTIPFQQILALPHGLLYINENFGGFGSIERHTRNLSDKTRETMRHLCHDNGTPVCHLYEHSKYDGGPIIAFNLKYSDSSYVPYSQVIRLAAASNIHIRAGCFCNPGACQDYLEWTSSQVMANYHQSGHSCSSFVDVIDQKPTGALRISFGFANSFDDVDYWLKFLKDYFVAMNITQISTSFEPSDECEPFLSKIEVYPIKSCAGYALKESALSISGLQWDRSWLLTDVLGNVMTQKRYPQMSKIQVLKIWQDSITIQADGMAPLIITKENRDEHDAWFTRCLQHSCRLAYNHKSATNVDEYLLISESSLKALSNSTGLKYSFLQFRPNLIIRGFASFEEENWIGKIITIGQSKFEVTSKCERCAMIGVDPNTGNINAEFILKLAGLKRHKKMSFGVYLRRISGDHVAIFDKIFVGGQ
jgi:molybdenum cofactor sulfurtransferase